MSIDFSKLLYVYNSGDELSLKLAQEYCTIRQIPSANMLGIDTFTKSIFSSRSEFEEEILNKIIDKISLLGGFPQAIHACVLGFRIPSGYSSEFGTISCCSALSGYYANIFSPSYNPAYRKNEREKNISEFGIMPCCQHDMPTYSSMKKKIEEFSAYRNGISFDGFLYFDRWNIKKEFELDAYASELESFENNFLIQYFDKYYITSKPIDDLRSDFGFAERDSIFWSSGLINLNSSFFGTKKINNRIFFFNADSDSFKSFRSDNVNGPSVAALLSGYQSSAGMISDFSFSDKNEDPYILDPYLVDPYSYNYIKTSDCWLRPEPFFQSLYQDFTILESMYFSSPIICCPMTYFTDPITKVAFKDGFEINEKLTDKEAWKELHEIFSEVSTYLSRRSNAAVSLMSRATTYGSLEDKLWALNSYRALDTNSMPMQLISEMNPAFSAWKKYSEVAYFDKFEETGPSFLQIANSLDFKFTNSFIKMNTNFNQLDLAIDSSNKEKNGFFILDTSLPEEDIGTGFFQIKAEIYLNEDDENAYSYSISYSDRSSWRVQDFDKKYIDFPKEGLFSSLKDRKIKFYNRTQLPNKQIGDEVWVKFTFSLNYSQEITSNLHKAIVTS